jgi:hypothetical protein
LCPEVDRTAGCKALNRLATPHAVFRSLDRCANGKFCRRLVSEREASRTSARAGNDSDLCCDSAQTPNGFGTASATTGETNRDRRREYSCSEVVNCGIANSASAKKLNPVCVGLAGRERFHRRARAVSSLDHRGLPSRLPQSMTRPATTPPSAVGASAAGRRAARAGVAVLVPALAIELPHPLRYDGRSTSAADGARRGGLIREHPWGICKQPDGRRNAL